MAFPTISTKIVPSKADRSFNKNFAIQKLKIKGSDEREKWDAFYIKSGLPYTNLYINKISENEFLLFGYNHQETNEDSKSIGFFYSTDDKLFDYKEDMLYLEEHGVVCSEDEKSPDAFDKSKKLSFNEHVHCKVMKTKPKMRNSRECLKSFPDNNYYIKDKLVYLWCEEDSLLVLKTSKPEMIPSIKQCISGAPLNN